MKIRPNTKSGVGLLALGIVGGLGAMIVGLAVGFAVYRAQTFFKPRPALVTNINGMAQSPFDVGASK